ncbi:hypothetical protein [Marinobacter sp. C2H3]|uniref:hypothetical protein n=1 Tax=Marinobacter sp. C2H3 TaxID=3119003 RepID=UPI00300F24E2
MVFRLFLILLTLNLLAMAFRADAADLDVEGSLEALDTVEQLHQMQRRVSGEFDEDDTSAAAELGSRLLSLTLFRSHDRSKRYAYESTQADHGIALLENGACLRLRWKF